MIALVVANGKMVRVTDAPDGLEYMNAVVGGYIESVVTSDYGGRERIVVWGNEDAIGLGLPPNVIRHDGTVLRGPLLILGCTPEGDSRGLTPAEERRVRLIEGTMWLPQLQITEE